MIHEIFSSRYYALSYSGEQIDPMKGPGEDAGLCGAGALGSAVGTDGLIRPCLGLNVLLGSFREDGLTKIWHHSPFFREFGRFVPKISKPAEPAKIFRCVAAVLEPGTQSTAATENRQTTHVSWATQWLEPSGLAQNPTKKGGDDDETDGKSNDLLSRCRLQLSESGRILLRYQFPGWL